MIRSMKESTLRSASPKKEALAEKPSGRQRVLETAERLFSERGFLGVSASEIAKEAGVAHGLLFHHFGSMEELYGQVTRVLAERMDEVQMASFRGRTAREQIASFLRAHMRAIKLRKGDAVFRARSLDANVSSAVAQIWEASRQKAIDRIFEAVGIAEPTRRTRVCLRAWIGFHDQLVAGWIAERSISEADVLEWTMMQLDQLASHVLDVDLNRPV